MRQNPRSPHLLTAVSSCTVPAGTQGEQKALGGLEAQRASSFSAGCARGCFPPSRMPLFCCFPQDSTKYQLLLSSVFQQELPGAS